MRFVKIYCFFISLLFLTFFNVLKAQVPYAERPVSLNAQNYSITQVFDAISAQTGVIFSYTSRFDDKQLVSYKCRQQPLGLVISDVLKSTPCNYKLKGKYVIIGCEETPQVTKALISGYVLNALDSSVIKDASIYIKETKQSTFSNNYGHFRLTYSDKLPEISLSLVKEHFKDAHVVIYNRSKNELRIYLYPKTLNAISSVNVLPSSQKDSLHPTQQGEYVPIEPSKLSAFFDRFKHGNPNIRNITDTLFNNVSISLVPKISTNSLLAFNTVNRFALNILSGYSKGIDGAEIGGIANIDNGNVRHLQFAGITNIVNGDVTGVQVAGILNRNGRNTTGVQVSGLLNINNSDLSGAQVAGFGNHQFGKVDGLQLAGYYNIARRVEGIQLAGFINSADTVEGLQIAGFINKGRLIDGIQLSVFNFSDSISAIPIGLFSYSKKGYHKLGIYTDESGFTGLQYSTGVDLFHNIFYLGTNYNIGSVLTAGYGLGCRLPMASKDKIGIELSQHVVHSFKNERLYYNSLSKVNVYYERIFAKKIHVGVGPTFNVLLNHSTHKNISNAPLYSFSKIQVNDQALQYWVGGSIFLKFF
jgi:hypothetical protein